MWSRTRRAAALSARPHSGETMSILSSLVTRVRSYAGPRDLPTGERFADGMERQLTLQQISQTRWELGDLEGAITEADSGSLRTVGRLCESLRRDGVIHGVLSTRTEGLIQLPVSRAACVAEMQLAEVQARRYSEQVVHASREWDRLRRVRDQLFKALLGSATTTFCCAGLLPFLGTSARTSASRTIRSEGSRRCGQPRATARRSRAPSRAAATACACRPAAREA